MRILLSEDGTLGLPMKRVELPKQNDKVMRYAVHSDVGSLRNNLLLCKVDTLVMVETSRRLQVYEPVRRVCVTDCVIISVG